MAEYRRTNFQKLKPLKYNQVEGCVAYQCPYTAPPYIDRVWRSLIGYEAKYKEICSKICFGYMLRTDPREGYLNSQDKYELCRKELICRKEVLKPFYNMWPEYKRHDEFINDFEFTVWVPLSHLNHFISYMGNHPKELGDINAMS